MRNALRIPSVLFAIAATVAAPKAAEDYEYQCGKLENAYGPFDYYADKDKLPIVENAHFTPGVEFFRERKTGPFGGDIDYTLRAFPNHPRALAAMMRLGEREKTEHPQGSKHTVFCYLERAVRFRPNDGTARLVLATYLMKHQRSAEAIEHLKVAEEAAGGNGNLHYNLGLAYLEVKDYAKALEHAHKAYQSGFDLPGLRQKLKSLGQWKEPPPQRGPEKPAPAESPATRPAME